MAQNKTDQQAENEAALNSRPEDRTNERVNKPAARNEDGGETQLLEEEMRAAKMGSFAPGTSGAKGPNYVAPSDTVRGATDGSNGGDDSGKSRSRK